MGVASASPEECALRVEEEPARRDQSSPRIRRLALTGLTAQLGGQAFINILVNLQLFPSKGMTLPLISYGGSSLFAVALTMGFALAVTRQRPKVALTVRDDPAFFGVRA